MKRGAEASRPAGRGPAGAVAGAGGGPGTRWQGPAALLALRSQGQLPPGALSLLGEAGGQDTTSPRPWQTPEGAAPRHLCTHAPCTPPPPWVEVGTAPGGPEATDRQVPPTRRCAQTSPTRSRSSQAPGGWQSPRSSREAHGGKPGIPQGRPAARLPPGPGRRQPAPGRPSPAHGGPHTSASAEIWVKPGCGPNAHSQALIWQTAVRPANAKGPGWPRPHGRSQPGCLNPGRSLPLQTHT